MTKEQKKIDKLIADVKKLVPEGYRVNEGFFMSLDTLNSSSTHVSVSYDWAPWNKAHPYSMPDRRDQYRAQKKNIRTALGIMRGVILNSMRVRKVTMDDTTLYIHP